jgi:DNA-binding NarL/FixJ family response regulator
MTDFGRTWTRSTDLAEIWRRLLNGEIRLVRVCCVQDRCFATLEERHPRGSPLSEATISVLERLLIGDALKVIAAEAEVQLSTVSQRCTTALRAIGGTSQPCKMPIFLSMAVQAARGLRLPPARVDGICPRTRRWVVSIPLPGATFKSRLTRCEWEVARLVIASKSHSQISRARGTSKRTVANQLAAAFKKLGISGQGELRARAVMELCRGVSDGASPDCP